MVKTKAFGMCAPGVLVAAILLAGCAGAVPVEEWNRTFGGKLQEYATSVQQTADGGYVLV